jgi:Domain of unknown function (DUF4136)
MNHWNDISLKRGEKEMRVFRDKTRFGYILAIIFGAVMILGGCAAKITYFYDPVANFSTIKSYSWAKESFANRQDLLIEKNVRYYVDQSLKNKGFTLTSDKPDFVIAMNYQTDYDTSYKLRMLTLYVYVMQGKELIWQGTAEGTIKNIKADAASSDLAEAVNKILMKFPPKR